MKQDKCRNNLLFYYADMYKSQIVFEAISKLDEERDWLVQKCRTISLANQEMPVFPLRDET